MHQASDALPNTMDSCFTLPGIPFNFSSLLVAVPDPREVQPVKAKNYEICIALHPCCIVCCDSAGVCDGCKCDRDRFFHKIGHGADGIGCGFIGL
jgi:hypothetical protein